MSACPLTWVQSGVSQPALLDVATPEKVGEDLARALASLLCSGLEHAASSSGTCVQCAAAGRVLAPSVGHVVLWVRRVERNGGRGPLRPLSSHDYVAVGRCLELLEELAGARTEATAPSRPGRGKGAVNGRTRP